MLEIIRLRKRNNNLAVPVALCILHFLVAVSQLPAQRLPGSEGGPATNGGKTYILQRGDELEIKVYNVPELTERVQIRPDGKISILLLDDLVAAGLTPPQLDERITARYAQYYRSPEVSVILRSFAAQKVFVGGEVDKPGVIDLYAGLTALTAVFQAGGFKETARLDSVILIRRDDQGGPMVQTLDLKHAVKSGAADPNLNPFDVVFVPKSRIAQVNQFVNQYIRQVIPLTLSGGFTYIFGQTARIGVP